MRAFTESEMQPSDDYDEPKTLPQVIKALCAHRDTTGFEHAVLLVGRILRWGMRDHYESNHQLSTSKREERGISSAFSLGGRHSKDVHRCDMPIVGAIIANKTLLVSTAMTLAAQKERMFYLRNTFLHACMDEAETTHGLAMIDIVCRNDLADEYVGFAMPSVNIKADTTNRISAVLQSIDHDMPLYDLSYVPLGGYCSNASFNSYLLGYLMDKNLYRQLKSTISESYDLQFDEKKKGTRTRGADDAEKKSKTTL